MEAQTSRRSTLAGKRRRILVIEDEEIVADGLCAVLELEGYEVVIAATCAEARRELESDTFAALIVDVGLPDGDGVELLQEMRAAGIRTPAVISTGRVGVRPRSVQIGNSFWLLKPYSSEHLLTLLDDLTRPATRLRDDGRLHLS